MYTVEMATQRFVASSAANGGSRHDYSTTEVKSKRSRVNLGNENELVSVFIEWRSREGTEARRKQRGSIAHRRNRQEEHHLRNNTGKERISLQQQ